MTEWTTILDVKGPHVHSDEHNPERDIPGTQTAPQPDNDPSGIAARLFRLAQQLEDQHAPQHMTILMREASNRLSNHRTETLEYLGQVGQLSDELKQVRDATLEEAAKVAETYHNPTCNCEVCYGHEQAAAAIRALKDKP